MHYESKCCRAEVKDLLGGKFKCKKCNKSCGIEAVADQTDELFNLISAVNERVKKQHEPEVVDEISSVERIVKNTIPVPAKFPFLHQYYSGGKWNPCTHCNEKLGTTSAATPSIEYIKMNCEYYKKYS